MPIRLQHPYPGMRRSVRSAFNNGHDGIEYLREGGWNAPDRNDMERMPAPGTFRTYGHAADNDGDSDFDSSYGDNAKFYDDTRAEYKFLHGSDDHEYIRPNDGRRR